MTFVELLILWLLIAVPLLVGRLVANKFGFWPGLGAGLLSAAVCVLAAILAYRARSRRNASRRREWNQKYCSIYRVLALPTDEMVVKKPQGAEIKVGDYGWEAVPLQENDLIYLQGLSPQWRVVWHAGFRPDQLEKVTPKPRSQYDWDKTWVKTPPPCPFPVQERKTTDMGLPI